MGFLRFINGSSNEKYDKNYEIGYINAVYSLEEIRTLISQKQNCEAERKVLYNNLACVCENAFETLRDFSDFINEAQTIPPENSEPAEITDFYTYGYSETEIFEISAACKNAASLMEKLLKMAEGGSIELQIAVMENWGNWYSMEKDESTARKYYQQAFELAQSYAKRTDMPWLSNMHSHIGESWRKQYKQTSDLKHLENAITAYQSTYQQWPEYRYIKTIANCMMEHAEAIYEQDTIRGRVEAEKILDFWKPVVQKVKKNAGIDVYVDACEKAARICFFIFSAEQDIKEQAIYYERYAVGFLEEGLNRLKYFPEEDRQRKFCEFKICIGLRNTFNNIYYYTHDKYDKEKELYYWKKVVDAEERAFGSAEKSDMMKLVEELEEAGYLEDAALYRKKAEKLEQEN